MSREPFATLSAVAILALSLAVAGCGTTDRIKTTSIPLEDYRARHPISLTESKTSIDIFPSLGQSSLDRHSAKQVYAFAEQYRDTGHGPVLIVLPRGRSAGAHRALIGDIRSVLESGGARNGVEVSTYPVADPGLASPIRLSFVGIKAAVADQCGQWPNDLASGSSVEGWDNKPYWNFGCAAQTMVAAQTSDPRDLVTPRGEEAPDALIRSRAIDDVRKGIDPNTAWQTKVSQIGTVGGN